MAEDGSHRRGCWKSGCFGCAILVAVPILIAIVLVGINLAVRGTPEQVESTSSHRVAAAAALAETSEATREPDRDALPEGPLTPPAGEGSIVLNVAYCELRIVPGQPGDPIRLEADYDAGNFDLEETFDTEPDGTWTYRLDFDLRTSLWLNMFVEADNRLRLVLPPDVPFRLAGNVRMGGGEMDFGGLHAREITMNFRMGGGEIDFSEPLAEPAELVRFDARMGGGEIRRLGNASPASAVLGARMGGFEVDLTGAWRNDGEIRVDSGMGGLSIRAPTNANVVLGDRTARLGGIEALLDDEPDPALPTVTIHVSATMGGVEIR